MGLDPLIAAQLLGTLIESSTAFLIVYLGIIIFIVQDKTLAPVFLRHWQVWCSFGICCVFWVSIIGFCVFDFVNLNSNVPFSSGEMAHEVYGFLGALIFSLITFVPILSAAKAKSIFRN